MTTMPTQQEILDQITKVKDRDVFGFEREDLTEGLDFEHVKPFLLDGVSKTEWEEVRISTVEKAVARIRSYMPFAFEKADGERGLSAMRSIHHIRAWLFLAGEKEQSRRLEEEPPGPYYRDALKRVCEHFGWDWKEWSSR